MVKPLGVGYDGETVSELAAFCVHPDYRGSGRGDSLLAYLGTQCQSQPLLSSGNMQAQVMLAHFTQIMKYLCRQSQQKHAFATNSECTGETAYSNIQDHVEQHLQ